MYLVIGLGITGQSVLRYLTHNNEAILAYDTREALDITTLKQTYPDVQFATGSLPKSWLAKTTLVVISPGIDLRQPWLQVFRQKGIDIIGDIELFARAASAPIIGITGSNGKSTVTSLTASLLTAGGYKTGMGGNIGKAALDLLLEEQNYDVFVLELSSFQLDTTYSLHTCASTVLNICEDHLDRYDGMDAYIQSKNTIYQDTELAVMPLDEPTPFWVPNITPKQYFGLQPPRSARDWGIEVDLDGLSYLAQGEKRLMPVSELKLQAPHQLLNALASLALVQEFDIDDTIVQQVLRNFAGLPHRTEWVAQFNQITWINDSKGTNVGATLTAVKSMGSAIQPAKLVLLAGGDAKGADMAPLAQPLAEFARAAIVYGRDAAQLYQAWSAHLPCHHVQTLDEAVNLAASLAQAGDTVLLSPACASLDQFDNYQHRGRHFATCVTALENTTRG
ncbi:UDP-N-acetylmuramoylalanine ligase [Thiomicrospira aerophila AL3]|uniref:UDP-N-acetylmuramoylalanine--D-glutamate ligase n=1 Tax=Thiomicrospira aerophila AL3 TaxID=717772 RepID=W0DTN1_9GAMM|nr:UDP-N-acetylmuramoyl-L-alanine--D-glutamate ligase [Thiomicrospira aerophila]AHF01792.1 UDP-N-acetylmuramoylalanine ligase [Thiomicrospira aerophila AL3]